MTTSVFRWEFAGASDVGRIRKSNEDSIAWDQNLGLALLADGMGGCNAGEVASKLAVDSIMRSLRNPLAAHWREDEWAQQVSEPVLKLYAAVNQANQAVYEASIKQPEYKGMGTTLLTLYFNENRAILAHIGDSRIFLWRKGALTQLTVDHTRVQEQVDSGEMTPEESLQSTNRAELSRVLGVDPVVKVDLRELTVRNGDIFLLCSDGCYDMLSLAEFVSALEAHHDNPDQLARQLVQKANENGGHDNISAVAARILLN